MVQKGNELFYPHPLDVPINLTPSIQTKETNHYAKNNIQSHHKQSHSFVSICISTFQSTWVY
jgi:hypothetical protein